MAEIAPFAALRYNPERFGQDLSKLIAPPYDVLGAADKDRLLARSDRNIVAIDLPHVPPKSAGPNQAYAAAAERLRRWIEDETLVVERGPALYVYHQQYTHAGQSYTRKMFFAAMRLEAFGERYVFPHEQTFGGPKEDRLKLMKATRCQLSAVFGLYNDPANAVTGLLEPAGREPVAVAELDGVANRLWVLGDGMVVEAVKELLRERAVYIADGHHRYSTALIYRDWLTANLGPLDMDHPAQFVLMGLCAMDDPGCIILPTHRVLGGFEPGRTPEVIASLQKGVRLERIEAAREPAYDAPFDVVLYTAVDRRAYAGTFTNRAVLSTLAPERTPPWRELDLAYLHRYLIDELVTRRGLSGKAPSIQYFHRAEDATWAADESGGIAVLCKPCTMGQLRAVSEAGDLMPQKSTFFYPKLATGLVIHPLE